MPTTKKKINLLDSEEGALIATELRQMTEDSSYNTSPSYSSNITAHPEHSISFVDKHMKYLNEHQNINPVHYISNLRLMTKLKKRIV